MYQWLYDPIKFPQVLIMSPPMTKESVHWTALGDIIHLDCDLNYTKAYTTVTVNMHLTLIDNNNLRIDRVLWVSLISWGSSFLSAQ